MAARRRLAPDERRAAILAVARDLFSRKPFAAVSVGEVAEAAGVSPPLVVFYFGSKRSLYLEVLGASVESIGARLDAVPGPPSLERLRASVVVYAGYAQTHRAGFLSLLRGEAESALPEAVALVGQLRDRVADRLVTDVLADLPDLDAAARAGLLAGVRGHLGFVDAAVTAWLDQPAEQGGLVTPATIADLAVGAFTGMLEALVRPGRRGRAGP